jgi:twitching motility protein PilJ
MGLLDRLKTNRPGDDAGDVRAPATFDDLQAAGDDGRTVAMPHSRVADLDLSGTDAGLASKASGQSIISELPPSEQLSDFSESRLLPAAGAGLAAPVAALPLIGGQPPATQQRILGGVVLLGLVLLVLATVLALTAANRNAVQVGATGQALMQSQRLAKAVSQALSGSPAAFAEVKEAAGVLAANTRQLRDGGASVPAVPAAAQALLAPLMPLVDRAEKNAKAVLDQQGALVEVSKALRSINAQAGELLESADTVSALKLQQGASAAELTQAGKLVMLTQRIGKSANEFLTSEGASNDAVFLLGKDLASFRDIVEGLSNGSTELRLPGSKDPELRQALAALLKQYEQTRVQASAMLGNLQGLVSAREAQALVLADAEPLRKGLQSVQDLLAEQGGFQLSHGLAMLAALALVVAGGWGFLRLYVADQGQRAGLAEAQRLEAERQEREAKRVNDANQTAILRLMNELQTVAEGDLTQQATVTEDITGAIADSINYTVEELRSLVSQVQGTANRVTETTEQVTTTSTDLLAASDEQLREIRETGDAVLQMAARINEVSAQAQQSAQVARQSLRAAETGLQAVQNSIGGMNAIRDQIQETSKRIKRLGESSQEIGEITELISDITEQTNVLALNAAIQAASAGEAGRGFSVVAEEVQRLAERSGDATRQISALVKTIQTDTQDAVAAMARSTQGVVDGARLSDAAGSALGDIDRVTRRLAELIEAISSQALREAASANVVADNIQHIFAVTEQTGDGTRSTAQMVRELARTAEELRQSVSRFKIG